MSQAMETCVPSFDRRALIAGLAALPVAVMPPEAFATFADRAAVAAAAPDPIFAALDAHRSAYDARNALICAHPEMDCDDIPGWEEIDDAEMDMFAQLVTVIPTTLVGCRALAEHAVRYPELFHSLPDENFERAFKTIATALSRLVPGA